MKELLGMDMVLDAAVREVVNKRSGDSSNSSLQDLEKGKVAIVA